MKYIVIGLGSFGAPLAEKLTALGNEVIGVDSDMNKVDHLKERISHTICMDATDEFTCSGLPIQDTDVVIVAIGEDAGANLMATAIFKNLKAKRLMSRAINNLHEKVLQAIGVDEIVHPEEETAERWAKKLCLHHVKDSFEIGPDHSIIEARVPDEYVGKTIREIGLGKKFNLLILTTIKPVEVSGVLGRSRTEMQVQGVARSDRQLESGDIMVLYGANRNLQEFLKVQID